MSTMMYPREPWEPERRSSSLFGPWGLLGLAALVTVAVGGYMLWPDLQRYLKIRNM
jgi:hypothetical protein